MWRCWPTMPGRNGQGSCAGRPWGTPRQNDSGEVRLSARRQDARPQWNGHWLFPVRIFPISDRRARAFQPGRRPECLRTTNRPGPNPAAARRRPGSTRPLRSIRSRSMKLVASRRKPGRTARNIWTQGREGHTGRRNTDRLRAGSGEWAGWRPPVNTGAPTGLHVPINGAL